MSTELYKNLASLSGANNLSLMQFLNHPSKQEIEIKKIENRDRKEKEDAEKAKEIIDKTTFVELPDPFE